VLAWLLFRAGHECWAGLLIGLVVAIKPNLGLWPVLLLVAGHRRPALTALGTALALSALPLLRYGPGVYGQWLAAVQAESWFHMPHYASLPSLGARLGIPGWGLAAAVLVGLAALLVAWRGRLPVLALSEGALLAAYLVSPSSSPRLGLFLVPGLLARPWTRRTSWAAALLTVPSHLILYVGQRSALLFQIAGLVYPAALLLLAGDMIGLYRRLGQPEPGAPRSALRPGTTDGGIL